MDAWLKLAKGPLFQFAMIFMILGLLRHLVLAWSGAFLALRRATCRKIPLKTLLRATGGWLFPKEKVKTDPLFSIVSILMHVGLVVVPVFLFSHTALWAKSTGIRLPSLPLAPSDWLTLITLACLFTLLALRIVSPSGRALSRFEDYALLILLAVPFASGYLALHPYLNPFPYKATMLVHVLSADLLLILTPLTKLSHAVLMPGTQIFGEVAWHFPADSGRKVAAALNKEKEPV